MFTIFSFISLNIIFFIAKTQYAFPNYTLNYEINFTNNVQVTNSANNIYVNLPGVISAYRIYDGVWLYNLTTDNNPTNSIAVTKNDEVVVVNNYGSMHFFKNKTKFTYLLPSGNTYITDIVLYNNGNCYVGFATNDYRIYTFNSLTLIGSWLDPYPGKYLIPIISPNQQILIVYGYTKLFRYSYNPISTGWNFTHSIDIPSVAPNRKPRVRFSWNNSYVYVHNDESLF